MKTRPLNRMYHEFTHLWPLVSPPEDYTKEAGYWLNILRAKLGRGRHQILELGVGGGNNLSHLTKYYKATAVDISKGMLKQCHKLNPTVKLHVGDMRTVRLGKVFKAVLIHDAISYITTEKDLAKVFKTAALHLGPGGVLIVAPDNYAETFSSPLINYGTNSDGKTSFTNIEYEYDPDPTDTTIESIMHFFIRTPRGLKIEQDRHILGLFPLKTWLNLMKDAGFTVGKWPYPVHPDGRKAYLLVGVLRTIKKRQGIPLNSVRLINKS